MLVIAVDGPSGAGKGELARGIARRLNLDLLETGLLYRAVAWKALDQKVSLEDVPSLLEVIASLAPQDLHNPELRSDVVAQAASKTAAITEVRQALLEFQRDFAKHANPGKDGVVLDGRDIGTKVLPKADIKLFITARPEIRAMRRFKELQNRGMECTFATVLEEMHQRDQRDQNRTVSPLKAAADACIIDTSDLTIEEMVEHAENVIKQMGTQAT